MIPMFERSKTVRALDRVATGTGFNVIIQKRIFTSLGLLVSRTHVFSFVFQASNVMALFSYAEMVLKHPLVVLLVLVVSSASSDPIQSNTTAVESRETKAPDWWPVVECVFLDDVKHCLQDRTVRAFVGLGICFL
jgi:hypothetical protein